MTFISWDYLKAAPDAERHTFLRNHINIGYHPDTYDDFYIHILDRYSGFYISGMPGSGKSGLLQNMILHDAKDQAVIVLDPHMDLVINCVGGMPTERLKDIRMLDMMDEDFPFGINIFNTGPLPDEMSRTQAIERILHIFEVLWPDVLSQQYLPRYLRMAIHVFLANPGTTLPDMYNFLIDDAYRRKLMARVMDNTVLVFWQTQYDNLPPATRLSRVQPLLGRLEQLFAGRKLVRNIVGQPTNSIDFRKAIEQKQIIFIKLPLKIVPEDARLIGTFLVAQIHAAVFSFVDIPQEQRPGVSLYIDECQNFATPDIAELITEGRKFGMRITLAHQYRGQLPKYLQEATMACRTKVVFQSTPEDGRELAHLFPAPSEGVRPEDVDPHATQTLINQAQTFPEAIQKFIEWYLLPIDLQAVGPHGNTIEIRDPGVSAVNFMADVMTEGKVSPIRVESPIRHLDFILQIVMMYGSMNLRIPAIVVRGFANCGYSFWPQVRGMDDNDKRLQNDIPALNIPRHLAIQTPDGWVWTRNPESGSEQLIHFLFHLRLTMRYLAMHPFGKVTTASVADVAKMLNQLQRRAAFVRSGSTVGVIFTHWAIEPDRSLDERIDDVRKQTRAVYCHPKAEVEKQFNRIAQPAQPAPKPARQFKAPIAPVKQQPPQLSGWEEA